MNFLQIFQTTNLKLSFNKADLRQIKGFRESIKREREKERKREREKERKREREKERKREMNF